MQPARHRYTTVDGLDLFYREAGLENAPTLLLLHGFPSSSMQYRYLMAQLADEWHLIAPDLPGFGLSAVPDRSRYEYSFANLATTIEHFLQALRLQPRALYLHDYGAQAGYRLLTRDAVRPDALVIQNSEAYYADGRTEAWATAENYWREPSDVNREKMRASVLNEEGIRREFLEELPAELAELIDPQIIRLASDQIKRPGVTEALLDLHRDYRSNVEHYAAIQAYFRERQPPTLVIWGRRDQYYTSEQADAFRRDLPAVQIELLDGGHWALESHAGEVAQLTRRFLASHVSRGQPTAGTVAKVKIPQQPAIRLAVGATLSGQAALLGNEMKQAVEMAVEECNAAGGIKGMQVELRVGDDKEHDKEAVALAEAFRSDPGVLAVIGHCFGTTSMPASTVYSRHGVPMLTPIASEAPLTDRRLPGIFRFTNRDDHTATALARHLYEKRDKRRAVIFETESMYGHSMAGHFGAAFRKLGGDIVGHPVFSEGERDFDSLIATLPSDFDLLFYGGSFEGAAILKALRRVGLPQLFAAGDGCWDRWNFLEQAGPDASIGEGVVVLSATPEVGKVAGSSDFARRYTERHGEIGNYAVNSYDTTRLILSAIDRATQAFGHVPDRDSVKKAIGEARFRGIAYAAPVEWDDRGDNLAAMTALHVVKDGRFQQVAQTRAARG
jgi:branched-chain amino acid transport system substrate-binding protein